MHDIPVIELILSLGLFAFAAVVFLWNYRHRNSILLSDIYIWVAGVLVGLGPLIAFALGSREFVEISRPMVFAYATFYLFFIGLLLSKVVVRRKLFHPRLTAMGRRSPIFFFVDHYREIPVLNVLLCFGIIFLLKLYDFSVGGGLSGFNTMEVQFSKNYLVVAISHLSSIFRYAVLIFCLGAVIQRWKKLYPVVLPILAFFALDAFLSGRRPMLALIVFGGFVAFALSRRIRLRHVLVAGTLFFVVFLVLSPFFLSFRTASRNVQATDVRGDSIGVVIQQAFEDAYQVDDEGAQERAAQNVGHRLMSVRYPLFYIFEAQQYNAPLFGRALFQIFTAVLPRHFRPYEGWYGSEQFIQVQLGMAPGDTAGSVPMLFVADFWLVGALIGGVFLGLYLNYGCYVAFLLWKNYPLVGLALFGYLFELAINIEIAPEFIFLLPRNVLIILGIFIVLRSMGLSVKNFEGAVFAPGPQR